MPVVRVDETTSTQCLAKVPVFRASQGSTKGSVQKYRCRRAGITMDEIIPIVIVMLDSRS